MPKQQHACRWQRPASYKGAAGHQLKPEHEGRSLTCSQTPLPRRSGRQPVPCRRRTLPPAHLCMSSLQLLPRAALLAAAGWAAAWCQRRWRRRRRLWLGSRRRCRLPPALLVPGHTHNPGQLPEPASDSGRQRRRQADITCSAGDMTCRQHRRQPTSQLPKPRRQPPPAPAPAPQRLRRLVHRQRRMLRRGGPGAGGRALPEQEGEPFPSPAARPETAAVPSG